MPLIILYLIKLSVCLAFSFLFYFFVLRKLTFYTWNRWYLLSYSLLSFFIPFINLSPVLDKYEWNGSQSISWLPVIGSNQLAVNTTSQTTSPVTTWQVLLVIILAGMLVLMIRILVQYISYCRLLKNTSHFRKGGINFYNVDENIVPFSFGKSIFLNPALHTKQELEEIIKHEMVHVKQQHTIDIIFGELLCILNWFSPFAWLIRKSIRQNLEFIADRKVLEHGFDKTDYQYLLLKVTGTNRFCITHQFNFSSLKKRIAMMNKLKTARVHILKFLFLIPVVTIVLLAFRRVQQDPVSVNQNSFIVTGIVFNARTNTPIQGVNIVDELSGIKTITDEQGYYVLEFPLTIGKIEMKLICSKEGYMQSKNRLEFSISGKNEKPGINFISLKQEEDRKNKEVVAGSSMGRAIEYSGKEGLYKQVKTKFADYLESKATMQQVEKLAAKNDDPIIVVNGMAVAFSSNNRSAAWFTKDEYEDLSDIKVAVDGKIMTIEEANNTVSRDVVKGIAAINNETAKKLFGVDNVVLGLYINTKFDPSVFKTDTLPNKNLPEDYVEFLKRNQEIKDVHWNRKPYRITINLKNGSQETYILDNRQEVNQAEKKYGKLPVGPPQPPPLPPGKEAKKTSNTMAPIEIEGRPATTEIQVPVVLDGKPLAAGKLSPVLVEGKPSVPGKLSPFVIEGKPSVPRRLSTVLIEGIPIPPQPPMPVPLPAFVTGLP